MERCWVIIVLDPEGAERDLAADRSTARAVEASCAGGGYARRRMVRGLGGPVWLRPRRAWCAACGRTQVLLLASCVPRRRDQVDQIGSALLAGATGQGHRPIAARLGVPEATVRGWLRRARAGSVAARAVALRWAHALDPSMGAFDPQGSPLGDALASAGAAIAAAVRRGITAPCPWYMLNALTGGRLLAPSPSG